MHLLWSAGGVISCGVCMAYYGVGRQIHLAFKTVYSVIEIDLDTLCFESSSETTTYFLHPTLPAPGHIIRGFHTIIRHSIRNPKHKMLIALKHHPMQCNAI